jgi:hypothetical protein
MSNRKIDATSLDVEPSKNEKSPPNQVTRRAWGILVVLQQRTLTASPVV